MQFMIMSWLYEPENFESLTLERFGDIDIGAQS